jgi:hypothetical protein
LGNTKWIAFQKNIIDKLKEKYNDKFNIIVYWSKGSSNDDIDYICVPYSDLKSLLTQEHLSSGNQRWCCIIKDNRLMVRANKKYSISISAYLNKPIEESTTDNSAEYSVVEGDRIIAEHLRIERDSKIVDIVKANRLKVDPDLHCDICGFSFVRYYGDIGKEFIEAHHKVPLSSKSSSRVTNESDFALVCSNCHRMLHRQFPALTIEELKRFISTKCTQSFHNKLL